MNDLPSSEALKLTIHKIDETGRAIYLYIPTDKVVLLQGYLETYEGIGIVRTISAADSLICIITTEDMASNCVGFLESIRSEINWQAADQVKDPTICLSNNIKET
jgi:hypothetical protein